LTHFLRLCRLSCGESLTHRGDGALTLFLRLCRLPCGESLTHRGDGAQLFSSGCAAVVTLSDD
jgi:hypothetical protein